MRPLLITAVLVCSAALLGCDESVDPILETDRQFSLFGALDMAADTQFVRVVEIRPDIIAPDQKLDVTFTSEHVETGEQHTWADSVYTFDNGTVGHIFYAPFRVLANQTYKLDVQRPGSDLITSATTTLPPYLPSKVELEKVFRIFTTQLVATQQVFWYGLYKDPYDIVQWYRFFSFSDFGFEDIPLSHKPVSQISPEHEGWWEMRVDLVRDRDTLLARRPDLFVRSYLAGLGITVTILDESFTPPGGVFTIEALGQPGTLSNVTNGFGFVGSIGRFSAEWLIQDTTATALNYRVLQEAHPEIAAQVWDAPLGSFRRAQ